MKVTCEQCGYVARSENSLDHRCEDVLAKRRTQEIEETAAAAEADGADPKAVQEFRSFEYMGLSMSGRYRQAEYDPREGDAAKRFERGEGEGKDAKRRARAKENRKARNDVLKSHGLTKVRGNLGGTYWE